MSLRSDQLLAELHDALVRERQARLELEEARAAVVERKSAWRKLSAAVEEIQEEIATGKTGRPVLDAIAGRNVDGQRSPASAEEAPAAPARRRAPRAKVQAPE